METKHPTLKNKQLEFFKRKNHKHKEQKQLLKSTISSNVWRACSLHGKHHSWWLTIFLKLGNPFTIGEKLILTAAKDICCELLGEATLLKVASILASTITRQIDEIAEDIEAQLLGLMSHCSL